MIGCLRKDVIAVFHNQGLKITINTNLTTTNFLDVTLDLITGKYFPYRKPNDSPLYVNCQLQLPTKHFGTTTHNGEYTSLAIIHQ